MINDNLLTIISIVGAIGALLAIIYKLFTGNFFIEHALRIVNTARQHPKFIEQILAPALDSIYNLNINRELYAREWDINWSKKSDIIDRLMSHMITNHTEICDLKNFKLLFKELGTKISKEEHELNAEARVKRLEETIRGCKSEIFQDIEKMVSDEIEKKIQQHELQELKKKGGQ
jgi:hypothetical protein